MNKRYFCRKLTVLSFFLTLFCGFGLVSCTDFYSTSLASWAQRDRSKLKVKVTPSNVDALISKNGNDPDTSLAILRGIKDAVSGSGGQGKLDLQSAALEAAANAAGLGNTVLGQFNGLVDAMGNATAIEARVQGIIDSLDNLTAASSTLLDILPDPADTGAFDAFIANSEPSRVALAAAVLLAAEAQAGGGAASYLTGFNPASPNTPNESMALALADGVQARYAATDNSTDDIIRNMLEQLKLI